MKDPFWDGRRVLVTGHTGFKGAWLALWLQSLGAKVSGLALPPEDETAAYAAMRPWDGLVEHIVDLRDAAATGAAVAASEPNVVFHLAAQSLVHRSYADPVGTYATNVLGTVHLLEALKATAAAQAVVVATTDKVYGHATTTRAFSEDDRLAAADPYSTSKACVELIVAASRTSDGEKRPFAATARAGNVIGGGDTGADRLVPDALRAIDAGEPLRVRYPHATRPWQHVLDPLYGYMALARRLLEEPSATPVALNFGPSAESCISASALVDLFFARWGEGRWIIQGGDHPAEASMLQLDASRAAATLAWQPRLDLPTGVQWTVEWERHRREQQHMRAFSELQVAAYQALIP